jgi:hypothetical protein
VETELNIDQTIVCSKCAETMRLVGIERDAYDPRLYLLTFECRQEHVSVTKWPSGLV